VSRRPIGFKAYTTFREMLEAVVEGHTDRAMLPIENTTAGSVYESYDLLLRFNLALVGEEIVDVRHCLLGVADVPLESLRRIHSHPQALSQCSEFLASLRQCEGVSAGNTALAAKLVRELKDPTQAAIASQEAAAHFGLHVLKRDIANQPVNYTRFVVVAATPVECDPRIAAKVSMVLATRHEHGALVRCLNVIADEGLNVTKLESRPRPGTPWEYVFYVDVEAPATEASMIEALAEVSEHATFTRVLGTYASGLSR
jgi:chorismate mutase / prephenate dehydratase